MFLGSATTQVILPTASPIDGQLCDVSLCAERLDVRDLSKARFGSYRQKCDGKKKI